MVNEIWASSMNLLGIEVSLVITFWIKFQKMRLLLVLKTPSSSVSYPHSFLQIIHYQLAPE